MTKKKNNYDGIASLLPPEAVDAYIFAGEKVLELDDVKAQLEKHTTGLKKGNPAAAVKKQMKAEKQSAERREWAANIFKAHLSWTNQQVAEKLLELANRHGHVMVNGKQYKYSTILKSVEGVKKEVLQQLEENAQK